MRARNVAVLSKLALSAEMTTSLSESVRLLKI